jgi:hypothetical protein
VQPAGSDELRVLVEIHRALDEHDRGGGGDHNDAMAAHQRRASFAERRRQAAPSVDRGGACARVTDRTAGHREHDQ